MKKIFISLALIFSIKALAETNITEETTSIPAPSISSDEVSAINRSIELLNNANPKKEIDLAYNLVSTCIKKATQRPIDAAEDLSDEEGAIYLSCIRQEIAQLPEDAFITSEKEADINQENQETVQE